MEKCSNHKEIDAIIYCQECNMNLCNKCKQHHSELFKFHSEEILDKDSNILSKYCRDEHHNVEFEYFCKTHNQLCCAKCISKFVQKGSGKHSKCDVCIIEDIKDKKKEILNENIKVLEELSKNLNNSIGDLKKLFLKINEEKETVIKNIQTAFTQLRNKINKREDELLAKLDKEYNRIYFKEAFLQKCEKLPVQVNKNLEQGKIIDKEWKDDKLSLLINNCLEIEKNIKIINIMNKKIKKFNKQNIKVKFYERYDQINIFNFEKFGNIAPESDQYYQFRQCPTDIEADKKYIVYNRYQNIVKKIGDKSWVGILTEKKLSKHYFHLWKIKITKTKNCNILLGVANIDFNNKSSIICGWFVCLCCGKLFSGPLDNLKKEEYENKNCNISPSDEIILISKKKSLLVYTKSNVSKIYSNISFDKPLYPAVCLKDKNDCLEITNCKTEYYNNKDLKNSVKKLW